MHWSPGFPNGQAVGFDDIEGDPDGLPVGDILGRGPLFVGLEDIDGELDGEMDGIAFVVVGLAVDGLGVVGLGVVL